VAQSVPTLEALAGLPLPIPFKPARGSTDTYVRIREQARRVSTRLRHQET